MDNTLDSTTPDDDTRRHSDSDASGPTLMTLPLEIIEQILKMLFPDKDVIRLSRGCEGRYWEYLTSGIDSCVGSEHSSENLDDIPKDLQNHWRNYKWKNSDITINMIEDPTCPQDDCWKYDDEFRYDMEPV